jgi:hypothetical protein
MMFKVAVTLLAVLFCISQGAVIVDREIDVKSMAEDMPFTVRYHIYNTFDSR